MSLSASIAGLTVSRETIAALEQFAALVQRWNLAINLVGKTTVADFWARHVVDSAQLFRHCPPNAKCWLDIGSGGGLPGLVIAILAKERYSQLRVTFVESDIRKATFLREACRTLGLAADVQNQRIESLPCTQADVLSARALAPLATLLAYAEQHMDAQGVALFPKGSQHESELAEARKAWSFDVDIVPSLSEEKAAVLIIRNVRRAEKQ